MTKHIPAPSLAFHASEGQTVVRFDNFDSLNESNTEPFGTELSQVAETIGVSLVLDFEPIHFVTSTALGKLVSLNRKVRKTGGRLVLRNVRETVQEILSITRLDTVFDVEIRDGLSLHAQSA